MSETKFTPGLWQIKSEINPWEVIANIDGPDDGRYHYDSICDCDQDSRSRLEGDETKANARLIASAPDLYAALLAVHPFIEEELEVRMTSYEDETNQYIAEARIALEIVNKALAKAVQP